MKKTITTFFLILIASISNAQQNGTIPKQIVTSVCSLNVALNGVLPASCGPIDSVTTNCFDWSDSICLGACMTVNSYPIGTTGAYFEESAPVTSQITVNPPGGSSVSACVTSNAGVAELFTYSVGDMAGCNLMVLCTLYTKNCAAGIAETSFGEGIKISPNPSRGEFTVSGLQFTIKGTIDVYNVLGEKVYIEAFNAPQGGKKTVNPKLQAGIYFVRVSDKKNQWTEKIIIQ